ncbi:FAA hydrolase family protein [Nocardioides immobilis]|uniref:FAA hydrolase family protein n=1 Tax=Nocardioides immobilis TaxID=2049295 RepID=A0A417XX48_9ACTN|nr:fumarylacetoacetate hydrolase family protein [Nocardioides immobilis]RHW24946.1 FAA hydrolase family protein [Nocardioides immobilis]
MRLARYGTAGHEVPYVITDDDRYLEVSRVAQDFGPAFFAGGGMDRLKDWLGSPGALDRAGGEPPGRVGAPIARPGKIVCIGINYADHAAEAGMDVPREPVVFLKGADTVVGPYDDVHIPRGATKVDWEVELGVVIGRRARYLQSEEDALECIAGYVVSHDVSERAFQLERGGQWDKGKCCETFNPVGPWLVSAEEVTDPQSLTLHLAVNGELMQDGSTSDMVFGVASILVYLSQFMVLEPGDMVNTGTPAGVALGRPEQPFLKEGDVVVAGIAGLGEQRQEFVAAP